MLTSFPVDKALAHAKQLSFPRRTGGPGWQRARDFLASELQGLGYGISLERFPIQADPFLLLRAVLSLTLLILVTSYVLSRSHPLLASALVLLPALAILSAGHLWNAWVSSGKLPFKPRPHPGANLVASLPPAREGQEQILLVAHYDSKSQSLSLVRRSLLLICLVLLCLIMSLLYLSASQVGLSPFPPPSRKQMGFLSAVSALCALMVYRNKTFDTSPGALDDASGVGTLLALAETLKAQPPSRVKVSFLVTDAEEEGLLGAWSYGKSHAAELSSDKPYVLNLDGVGIGGRLRLKGKFGLELAGKILQLAKRRGIPLKRCYSLPGVLMDHLPFAWGGLEAISLFCLSRKSLHIHTPKDRPDLLEERGMREVGELVLAFVQEVDKA